MRVVYRNIKNPTMGRMNDIKQILVRCRKKKSFEIDDAYNIEVMLDELAMDLLRQNVKIIERI